MQITFKNILFFKLYVFRIKSIKLLFRLHINVRIAMIFPELMNSHFYLFQVQMCKHECGTEKFKLSSHIR